MLTTITGMIMNACSMVDGSAMILWSAVLNAQNDVIVIITVYKCK